MLWSSSSLACIICNQGFHLLALVEDFGPVLLPPLILTSLQNFPQKRDATKGMMSRQGAAILTKLPTLRRELGFARGKFPLLVSNNR